jgi:hypothetical protein
MNLIHVLLQQRMEREFLCLARFTHAAQSWQEPPASHAATEPAGAQIRTRAGRGSWDRLPEALPVP